MSQMKKITKELLSLGDVKIGGSRDWDVQIHNDQLYSRIIKESSLGLGESYMDGWWDCKALDQFFDRLLKAKIDQKVKNNVRIFASLVSSKFLNLQNRKRSQKVADIHYNLDNDLYTKMLGPTMAYTCGYYKNTDNLDEAQIAKYELVCQKLQLKEGEKVLELGCGWGGFAKYAAKNYGVHMTSVNISKEQVKFATDFCKGLPVEFHLCDYRDDNVYNSKGIRFDKAVSIGLCEHVGHKNYKDFMKTVSRNLKQHGLFLLHTIGSNKSMTTLDAWIHKYIFPGGLLPSEQQLSRAHERYFIMEDWHNFGTHYDKTLMAWYKNFIQSWDEIKDRYDERFFRMWSYYLLSCAGMFRARDAQLWQIVLSKDGILGGYSSIR
jgi:cyclopropane-fatty-acyl-phospholipid synthase